MSTETETITVWYRAPVAVEVDPQTRTVRRVIVLDDSTEYWYCDHTPSPQNAVEIAESADWPVWEIGA